MSNPIAYRHTSERVSQHYYLQRANFVSHLYIYLVIPNKTQKFLIFSYIKQRVTSDIKKTFFDAFRLLRAFLATNAAKQHLCV
jgi:hypothetical protein